MPFEKQGESLERVFGSKYAPLARSPSEIYWQILSGVVGGTFWMTSLYLFQFKDDLKFDGLTWLQRRNGMLNGYFLVASIAMKSSHLLSEKAIDYRIQILLNFLLKLSCLVILTQRRPIFKRSEHIAGLTLAGFNFWLSSAQILRLVCLVYLVAFFTAILS